MSHKHRSDLSPGQRSVFVGAASVQIATATAETGVRALLADGRVIRLRELFPADEADVLELHTRGLQRNSTLS